MTVPTVSRDWVTAKLKELMDSGSTYDQAVGHRAHDHDEIRDFDGKEYNLPLIVSLNTLMADGTGMCGACRVTVGGKTKFACVDGPEFDAYQVDFDEAMRRQTMYKPQEAEADHKMQNRIEEWIKRQDTGTRAGSRNQKQEF